MLVQEYLKTKTYEDLTAELGVKVIRHDVLPLAILNYDQIESPKTHPVVRECRALVLNTQDHSLVARSFPRFFNWGEVCDEMQHFDFSDFACHSKEDGSLVLIYNFDGEWYCNTRGSFADGQMQTGLDMTWREGILSALNVKSLNDLNLDPSLTYVCEFCSLWNKVVRRYSTPRIYLLTVFRGKEELHWRDVPKHPFFHYPDLFEYKSVEEIQEYLHNQEKADPTFEGVVIRDTGGRRWKVKSATYLGLHRLRGEGDNLFSVKKLLPFVMAGEKDELFVYFPEVKDAYLAIEEKVNAAYERMMAVWEGVKGIESQKEFALAIAGKTPFTGVLFEARKNKVSPKDLWRNGADRILKILF